MSGYKSNVSWLLDMITNISRKLGSEVFTLHDASQKKIHSTIGKLPLLSTIKKGRGFYISKGFLIDSEENYTISLKKTNDYIKYVNSVLDDPNGISDLKLILRDQNRQLKSTIKEKEGNWSLYIKTNPNWSKIDPDSRKTLLAYYDTTIKRDLLNKNNGWIAYLKLRKTDDTIRDILSGLVKDVENQDKYNEEDKLKLESNFVNGKSATFEKGDPKWRKILLDLYDTLTNNTSCNTRQMLLPTPDFLIKYLNKSVYYDENKREMVVSDEDEQEMSIHYDENKREMMVSDEDEKEMYNTPHMTDTDISFSFQN